MRRGCRDSKIDNFWGEECGNNGGQGRAFSRKGNSRAGLLAVEYEAVEMVETDYARHLRAGHLMIPGGKSESMSGGAGGFADTHFF